jgi:hypothetical protein
VKPAIVGHMWALENTTPYAAGRNWIRDKDGVHWWLVAIRATFIIGKGGRITLADEQRPPVLAPECRGEPGESSLRQDSDLLEHKPATDVLVLACAHAPHGRPVTTVGVTLRAGPIEKSLVVHGERTYRASPNGLSTSPPRPFLRRSIIYEHAFGGREVADPDPRKDRIDERNPVGRGFARGTGLADTPAHTIEYPTGNPAALGPAGFGPIDRSWLPRRALAGTFDSRWAATKRPLLPDDHDPAFALCAPADQRGGLFRGGERVELVNLSPESRLAFDVPQIDLGCVSHFGARMREHVAQLATIVVEPDEQRLTLVWQSALRCAAADADYLDVTEIIERRSAS